MMAVEEYNYSGTSLYDYFPITISYLYFGLSLLMFIVLIQNATNLALKEEGLKKQGMLKENICKVRLAIYWIMGLCFFASFVTITVLTILGLKEFPLVIGILYLAFPLLLTIALYLIAPTIISLTVLNILEYPLKRPKKISPAYVPIFLILQASLIPITFFDFAEGALLGTYAFLIYLLTVFLALREFTRFRGITANYLKDSKEEVLPVEPQKRLYVTILIGIIVISAVAAALYSLIMFLFLSVMNQLIIVFSIYLAIFILSFVLLNSLIIYLLISK